MTIRRVLSVIIISLILSAALAGCSGAGHDPRLERVAEAVDSSPADALSLLDSIDRESLGEKDRHYHDFLTVKARDKAYITHTSDSLISSAISYYERHDKGLYPEALYYGGRVYSDLGDFPTALRYFQQSLDLIPDDRDHRRLRGNALAQTGFLLNQLRLYSQAVPYICESLRIDSIDNRSIDMMEDLLSLGAIYFHSDSLVQASECFSKALELSDASGSSETPRISTYIAAIQLRQGNVDSALSIIRPLPERADSLSRNMVMAHAAEIYLSAGRPDTAFMYADEIIRSKDSNNRKNGYRLLLSPSLSHLLPKDSVTLLASGFSEEMEKYYNLHESQSALIQNSFYNYELHERARLKVETVNRNLWKAVSIVTSLLLICVAVILWRSSRYKNVIIALQRAHMDLDDAQNGTNPDKDISPDKSTIPASGKTDPEELRTSLREKLLERHCQTASAYEVPDAVINSEPYGELINYISNNKNIPEDNDIWRALEKTVMMSFPDFKVHLHILTKKKLTVTEWRLALLIKCGVTPTQMSTLLSKEKGTISYHRTALSRKIFDRNIGNAAIDGIIRCL